MDDWEDNYYGNMVKDEDGISYPGGMRGMFESKILGFCGCCNDEIVNDIINVIKLIIENSNYIVTNIANVLHLDEKYIELIFYVLDNKGLLEHGSSIRASWISEKGKKILEQYKEVF